MRKSKLFANISKIRGDKTYTTKELASVLGCSTDVIYDLLKGGLPYIAGSTNPYYFDGREVKDYLKQMKKKAKAKPNEFRCFECKHRRESLVNNIEIIIKNKSAGKHQAGDLIGKCIECGSRMSKFYTYEKAVKDFPHLLTKYNNLESSTRPTTQSGMFSPDSFTVAGVSNKTIENQKTMIDFSY